VYLELEGPVNDLGSFIVPQYLTITADVNFNGLIDEVEQFSGWVYSSNWMEGGWGALFGEYAGYHVRDDGPSPGNGTSSDPIDVHVQFAGDSQTKTITAENVAPQIVTSAALTYDSDQYGNTLATVSVSFYDPGYLDTFTASVTWGDGVVSESNSLSFSGIVGVLRTVSVTRQINTGTTLIPLKIDVSDDDLGEGERKLSKLDVASNTDDDNQNSIEDLFDDGFADDDLKMVSLDGLKTSEMNADEGVFQLHYGMGAILLWTSQSKTTLILPSGYYSGESDNLSGINYVIYSDQSTAWVEGVSPGVSSITIGWIPGEDSILHDFVDEVYGNSINVGVWGIDLDIDSDNDNGFDFPDNSAWEEYLEDSPYGIGKMIEPNASHFTPLRLRLPGGLNPNDPQISIKFEMNITGQSGVVLAWNTFKADPGRTNTTIDDGGNRVMPDVNYSLRDLRYDPASGGITIFLDAFDAFPRHSTKKGVDDFGKPDDRVKAIVVLSGLTLDDEVKYMAVDPDTFYPNLQARRELRSAFAATEVYLLSDAPQFALKLLSDEELSDLGVSADAIALIGQPDNVPGFKSAIYWDHISNSYILAFAGTDDVNDVVTDVWQGLGGYDPQYLGAMTLANLLVRSTTIIANNFSTTGHSLGGGLASAAAVVAGIPGDTFNAAGLHIDTLRERDVDGNPIPDTELYRGSIGRYSIAASFINAYYVDYDILSTVQDAIPGIPNAIGNRIPMDGPHDTDIVAARTLLLASWLAGFGWVATYGTAGANWARMVQCHFNTHVHYGLMFNEDTGWDIYGYQL